MEEVVRVCREGVQRWGLYVWYDGLCTAYSYGPNDNIHHVNTVPLITMMDAWLTGLNLTYSSVRYAHDHFLCCSYKSEVSTAHKTITKILLQEGFRKVSH